jgi:hypothetical protein
LAAAVVAFYVVCFGLITWPAARYFGTHVFAGPGDGLQMYWNTWWVRHAVTELGTNPFSTDLLFHPRENDLLLHSLHSFGGFLGIPLSWTLSDVGVFNALVCFGFAFSGWGGYVLARALGCNAWTALIGGYVFTFSNYHFAHAQGHLNLVLMQWIPFYLFFFFKLVVSGALRHSVAAAVFLFLVLLCDHYYFMFCVLASVVIAVWSLATSSHAPWSKKAARSLVVFGVLVLFSSGVFALLFLQASAHGAAVEGHDVTKHGMDLFALILPGGHWRFHELSAPYWRQVGGSIHGASVHVGIAALILAYVGYRDLRSRGDRIRHLLLAEFIVFFALSLGAELRVVTHRFDIPMPYDVLAALVPVIEVGGVPNRFIVIAILSVALLASCGVRALQKTGRGRAAAGGLLLLAFVELLPRPIPLTPTHVPTYMERFVTLSSEEPGPVLDLIHRPTRAMFFQTLHHQPIQTGFLARLTRDANACAEQLSEHVRRGEFEALRDQWGYRYVFSAAPIESTRLLIRDRGVYVSEIPVLSDEFQDWKGGPRPCPLP